MPTPETETAPEPPAGADQDSDQPDGATKTQKPPPAGADQGNDAPLFTDEETKGLPPDLQARVQGMVKKFTQTQQSLGKDREQLAQLTAQLRELAAQQESETASEPSTQQADALEQLLSKAGPADKEVLRTLASAIEERLKKQLAPITENIASTRYQNERERVAEKYPDFEQVVTKASAGEALRRFPGISSYEALYKLIKFEDVERESKSQKAELQKLQARMKQSAGTEMPMGMSAEAIEGTEFSSLTKAQRQKLTPKDYVDMAERMLRNSR